MSEIGKLKDPLKAVQKIITDISSGPWVASTEALGYITVNGKKAQVQVRVTIDEYEFIDE